MDVMVQAGALAKDELHLLAYVQYMAQTAKSDEARQMFRAYLEQAARRMSTAETKENREGRRG